MKGRIAGLMLGAAVALAAARVSAQSAVLLNGFGGPADFGVNSVLRGNNVSSDLVDLTSMFPNGIRAAGTVFTSVYVNTSGNVSLGSPSAAYTMAAFPGATVPMLAAWWADIDTTLGDAAAENDGVYWNLQSGSFVATWYDVGYFNLERGMRNSFQLVLTDASSAGAPGDIDIEYRYNQCQWATTDFGPAPAVAGYDFTAIPAPFGVLYGSGSPLVLQLCVLSNAGSPGIWEMRLRGGVMQYCGDGVIQPGEACDPAIPPFMGCTLDCQLCGDPLCSDGGLPDVVLPDAVADAPLEDVGTRDGMGADGGLDAIAPADADASIDALPQVQHYGGGGLVSCAVRAPGHEASVGGLLAVFAAVASRVMRLRRGRVDSPSSIQ